MNIVIAGGGFGGVRAALKLANKQDFSVRLISDKNYFEYHAALYRSATGRSPLEVTIPLSEFFEFAKNIEVVQDSVVSIDSDQKIIQGESGSKYHYDKAVLALGNQTEYFNISGLDKYSYGVKDIQDALRFKNHLHEQLSKQAESHYVVVGGGPTGVELAAELTAYIKNILDCHCVKSHRYHVDLVEAQTHVLPGMPENFSRRVEERLKQLGVTLHLGTAVRGETADSLQLPDREIASRTVVWTAGITNNDFFKRNKKLFLPGRLGRAKVDRYLQVHKDIYCIGDSADTPMSGLAQTALHDADFVAGNLIRESKGEQPVAYQPPSSVNAIPVGPRWSAVRWGGLTIYGFFGWCLRRLADFRLYRNFLPLSKALSTWHYGMVLEESCPVCQKKISPHKSQG